MDSIYQPYFIIFEHMIFHRMEPYYELHPSMKIYMSKNYNQNYIFTDRTRTENSQTYSGMINRCSGKYPDAYPTYTDCNVCDEWLNDREQFYDWANDNFYKMITFNPETGCMEEINPCLDKDILVKGNRTYSPDTCMFVPSKINSFFAGSHRKKANGLPQGVEFNKDCNKYACTLKGIDELYDTPEEAWETWRTIKDAEKTTLAYQYYENGLIPTYVFKAIMNYKFEITD